MRKNQRAKSAVMAFDLSKVDPKKKEEARLFQELYDSGVTDIKVCAERLGLNNRYLYSNLDLYAVINGKADKHEAYGIKKYNRKTSESKNHPKKVEQNVQKSVVSEEENSRKVISNEVASEETTTTEKSVTDKAIVNVPEKAMSVEDLLDLTMERANKLIEGFEEKLLEFDTKVSNSMKEENNYEW